MKTSSSTSRQNFSSIVNRSNAIVGIASQLLSKVAFGVVVIFANCFHIVRNQQQLAILDTIDETNPGSTRSNQARCDQKLTEPTMISVAM